MDGQRSSKEVAETGSLNGERRLVKRLSKPILNFRGWGGVSFSNGHAPSKEVGETGDIKLDTSGVLFDYALPCQFIVLAMYM